MRAFKEVYGKEFNVEWIPDFAIKSLTLVKIPATKNAPLATRFSSGQEAIRPLIFSHGLSADKSFYTAVYHAMAAHGYLVIAVNHQDESCFYTEDKNGKPIPYVLKELYCSLPYRQA